MKKVTSIMVCCLVLMVLCFVSPGGFASAADKPIKVLFAHFEPPIAPVGRALKDFAKDVEERSNGRIKTSLAMGGALGKPGDYFDLVSKGVCDVSACVPTFNPGNFPMTEIMALPFILTKGETMSKVVWEFYKKGYLDKELSAVKVIGAFCGQGEKIFMPDKPVTMFGDLKGKKIFASSAVTQEKVRALGGVPLAMPVTDLYASLQKGVIDGFMGDWAFLFIFRLHEQVKYATVPTNGGMFIVTAMNKKKYASLPPDIQKMFDDLGVFWSIKMGVYWDMACKAGKQRMLDKGGKIVTWKDGEMAKVEKAWAPIWTKWIEETGKKGLPAQKAVDDLYNVIKDVAGLDPAAVGYRPK